MPAAKKSPPPTTPDGRYIVVRGLLWRAANPHLTPEVRARLVSQLMDARRAVKQHLHGDEAALRAARTEVQAAKVALGERGPPWWHDGTPCLNRRKVQLTPYAAWYAGLSESSFEGREP